MFRRIQIREATFQPAAVGTPEAKDIIPIARGECVVGVWIQLMIAAAAASTSTISVGDSASVTGYCTTAALDIETGTVGNLVDSNGTHLVATKLGKTYNAADAIRVDYVIGTPGVTNPKVKVFAAVLRVAP